MTAPSRVRIVDRGADGLVKAAREAMGDWSVRVGIMGSEAGAAHEEAVGMTVAEVAEKHEFGIGVPRRSWLLDYVDATEEMARRRLRSVLEAVTQRKAPLAPGLEQFGQITVGEIQQRIADRIDPPLSEATIAAKGSDVPLINTGQLRSSITYVVLRGAA